MKTRGTSRLKRRKGSAKRTKQHEQQKGVKRKCKLEKKKEKESLFYHALGKQSIFIKNKIERENEKGKKYEDQEIKREHLQNLRAKKTIGGFMEQGGELFLNHVLRDGKSKSRRKRKQQVHL